MRARNVQKQAEPGKKLVDGTNADLWMNEMNQLHDIYISDGDKDNGFINAVYTAFLMGVAVGARVKGVNDSGK